jgi:ankyrin repeat protein
MASTELHQAVRTGDLDRVSKLLDRSRPKADVNARDRKGWTPLAYALASPDAGIELLRVLMDRGAIIEESSLRLAFGDPRKVAVLIEAGADIHYQREHGYDALLHAVHGRDVLHDPHLIELLNLLIANGVSVHGMSTYGESAVRVLSRIGRFDAVQLLLRAGANADDLKLTTLIEAVAFGSLADVRSVIESDVDPEERDHWERTAWLVAIQTGDIRKAEYLLEHGSDRNARGRCGRPALFYAIENCHGPMLKWLLEIGTDISQMDDFGTTALITAVERGDQAGVDILLKAGALVNQATPMGTPLSCAGTESVAMTLIAAGADPQHLSVQGRRAILGYSPEPDEDLLEVSATDFAHGRTRRFGRQNPESMDDPFWYGMIRSGISAYEARKRFGVENRHGARDTPVWCAQRFGQSITFLPDGRIVEVGGEHEDHYDPDFCIYNDVFVHEPDGQIQIYGYPESEFPPTDFHTATLIENDIYLIGSLGYLGTRRNGATPVYRLDTKTFRIERIQTTGDSPGWIFTHRAVLSAPHEIRVFGGEVVRLVGDQEDQSDNTRVFVLDIERRTWRLSK